MYIRKSGNGYRIDKCFNRTPICFGTYETLEEAVKKRDELINSNWSLPIDHVIRNRRNISEKNGKFIVVKVIDGSRKFFGTYSSIEEAIKKRNELIESNWENWEKPINPYQFIERIRHKFGIRKSVNGINKRFGYFYTLEEAVKRRDELIALNWPESIKHKNPKYITRVKKSGKFRIRKNFSGKIKYFGTFDTLEEAIERRDVLIRSNWGIKD